MFEVACGRADTDDEFQTTFAYCEFLMPKHINETIVKKDDERKERHDSSRAKKEPKAVQLKTEMEEQKERRKQDINLIHLMTCEGSLLMHMQEWMQIPKSIEKNKEVAVKALKPIADSRCDP
jgi:hypothetical protein